MSAPNDWKCTSSSSEWGRSMAPTFSPSLFRNPRCAKFVQALCRSCDLYARARILDLGTSNDKGQKRDDSELEQIVTITYLQGEP